MTLAAAYVIMALGLNVVVGFAGLLDLGYVAFYAIGAHVAAHFGSSFWDIHLDFLIIMVLAVVATAIAGALIGVPTLRLRGDYIGIVTLAFGEIIGQAVSNGRRIEFLGGSLTGGPNGIAGIDKIDLPFLEPFGRFDLRPWYWFALALRRARAGGQLPAARLASGAGVDRAARRRARGGVRGRPDRADEAAGLRSGGGAGRRVGRLPGVVPERS